MNYSRKQLYALGEPFGESATRLKPGGRVYGGGGGSTPADTTQTTTAELPEWARGYAKDTLAKTSALTDINKNPYQQYGGERIAGFQPMQQQAFEGAANMQPSEQVGMGTGLAGAAGLGALGTNYQGGQFQGGQFDTQAAQQYMNPYSQNVVDYQKSQALRDFQIAQPMRNAQAVQQGAFGGSRSAIVDAEAQRSLNSQLQGIEATGQQAAFQNAQQQFNADQARRLQAQQLGEQSRQYGAGLGLQGLQTGLQAAGTLGTLGQTQYAQQLGINQLQNQYGAQQQAQAQRPLDVAYQDFLNQQNYPYKQLGFMSDMIRGLPLGQQSTAQMYQAPPSTLQTVGALGMGAYGINQLTKADGGLAGAYAGGGMVAFGDGGDTRITDSPMDDPTEMAQAVSKLSDEQLQDIIKHPSSAAELQAAKLELATRASEKTGLASAYNAMQQPQMPQQAPQQMPPQMAQQPQQPMVQAARGGIMHFLGGGETDDDDYVTQEDLDAAKDEEQNVTAGLPMGQLSNVTDTIDPNKQVNDSGLAAITAIDKLGTKAMTPEQYASGLGKINTALRTQAGTDTGYEQLSKDIADARKGNESMFEQQKGLAVLAAIPEMLKGGNAARGFGNATGKVAELYGQYASADKKQKLALSEMQFKLADAKRKENLGLTKDAVAGMESVRKSAGEADKFELDKVNAKNKLLKTVALANKPVKGPNPNYDIQAQAAHAAAFKDTEPMRKGETPEQYERRIQSMAFEKHTAAKNAKVSDITTKSNVTSNVTGSSEHEIKPGGTEARLKEDANAIALAKERDNALKTAKNSIEYMTAYRKNDTVAMQKILDAAVAGFPEAQKQLNPAPTPAPTSKAAPAPTSKAAPAPAPKAAVNMPPVSALKQGMVTTFANGQKWTLNAKGQPVQVK